VLYVIFAFEEQSNADVFVRTFDVELANERKLVPIDWDEMSMNDVKEQLPNLFTGSYNCYVFCEVDPKTAKIIKTKTRIGAA
jgi:hypothetical protein